MPRLMSWILLLLLWASPFSSATKGCGAGTATTHHWVTSDKPFRALWNQAWIAKCAAKVENPFNLSAFGDIEANPNATREGPVICTPGPNPKDNSGMGLYPSFHCDKGFPFSEDNCKALNGGSPQLGNLSAHLEAWRRDVVQLVPDPNATTVINIDWEKWWPTWESTLPQYRPLCDPLNGTCNQELSHNCKYCKYYLYGEVARRLARADHPGASSAEVEAAAKNAWETTAVEWLVRTVAVAKQLRPAAVWGFWDLVPGRISLADSETRMHLEPLWNEVTGLFPSIYITSNTSSAERNRAWVETKLAASRAIADARRPVLPIYAYTNPEYLSPPLDFLSGADFASEYALPGHFGLAGLALYGGSMDGGSKERCLQMRRWAASALPVIENITREREACAEQHCAGHGRCIDYNASTPATCACVGAWEGPGCKRRSEVDSRKQELSGSNNKLP